MAYLKWSGVCVYLHNGKQGETFNDLSWPFFLNLQF